MRALSDWKKGLIGPPCPSLVVAQLGHYEVPPTVSGNVALRPGRFLKLTPQHPAHEEEYLDDDEEMDDGAIPESTRSNDAMLTQHFEKEFDSAWREWKTMARAVDWRKEFPDELKHKKPQDSLDPMEDLLSVPIGELYEKLMKKKEYGHLPTMARCYAGANLSESFCERLRASERFQTF